MTTKPAAIVCCAKHPTCFLLDVLEGDGTISHLCNVCQRHAGDELAMVNVVKQLHRRASEMAAERVKKVQEV
jgi:hypothetical protein